MVRQSQSLFSSLTENIDGAIAEGDGDFLPLGARHYAFFAEEQPQLLVTFEDAATLREREDKLPEHYRSVVLLADVHEFDYKEIAQILEIPMGTVMSRLNRARTQLKKSLAGVAREYGINTQPLAAAA